jgi:hypothetical protein
MVNMKARRLSSVARLVREAHHRALRCAEFFATFKRVAPLALLLFRVRRVVRFRRITSLDTAFIFHTQEIQEADNDPQHLNLLPVRVDKSPLQEDT